MIFSTSSFELALAIRIPPVRNLPTRDDERIIVGILLQISNVPVDVIINFFNRCDVMDVDDEHVVLSVMGNAVRHLLRLASSSLGPLQKIFRYRSRDSSSLSLRMKQT